MRRGSRVMRLQVALEPGLLLQPDEVRSQFATQRRVIGKGKFLRLWLEEEIEGIEYRHLGDQPDFEAQFPRWIRKHHACEVVRLGILLPVDEMRGRRRFSANSESIRVRQCGAGRSLTVCGPTSTGLS